MRHVDHRTFLRLLINTALLEDKLRNRYKTLLSNKNSTWHQQKSNLLDQIGFLTKKSETEVQDKLWIQKINEEVNTLEYKQTTDVVKTIGRLTTSITGEVKEISHNKKSVIEVKDLLDLKMNMMSLLRTTGIKKDVLITLQIVSNFNYAWTLITGFTEVMQSHIKVCTSNIDQLRSLFLKVMNNIICCNFGHLLLILNFLNFTFSSVVVVVFNFY